MVELSEATAQLKQTRDPAGRAELRRTIKEIRTRMADASLGQFLNAHLRVITATSHKAMMLLNHADVVDQFDRGAAPFTTVVIDEAGLVSRAATAVLSLLAARRVVLVGDSKQLAPISRISRVIEPLQGRWLAKSGLSHLDRIDACPDGVHALREQYRMHPAICGVVSSYHYGGALSTAPMVLGRQCPLPDRFAAAPRAIWCVLDQAVDDLPAIRAQRGPGNRSWVRHATFDVLERLFAAGDLNDRHGLFISPYRAQAKLVGDELARQGRGGWSASTVHSQQGAEADMVVFDTVNAGSCGWPYEEWKRLVNVGLSRARESLIVLASRAEMDEPFLSGLRQQLVPCVLQRRGDGWEWERVELATAAASPVAGAPTDDRLGSQLQSRRTLRPVMSEDQQRLCGLSLDGKPRLVRGVAGSGKTAVLASWLAQSLERLGDRPDTTLWAVFANRTLQSLLVQSIEKAWRERHASDPLPWERVSVLHLLEVLEGILPTAGLQARDFGFDYDAAAAKFLNRADLDAIAPRCQAIFIDEAQDMGPSVLRLLSLLVEQSDPTDPNSRSVNIFFDNAQNIYGRGVPMWSRMGLDLRGRSTVLKESFRSTRPIFPPPVCASICCLRNC
ncbi:AAA domain-containing protein [Botrimarina mediterranea]|uniref:AAA domain-containing protein n=1 Tax=Botrimarina mediterranea TaxID=2528022 RepID=UPI00118C172D|nr:Viral (Superfamily 1) RNA helicase [Planctomycetes bacterium K2D]